MVSISNPDPIELFDCSPRDQSGKDKKVRIDEEMPKSSKSISKKANLPNPMP